MEAKVSEIINLLELIPHPEGGFYRETYRSGEQTGDLPGRFRGKRSFATGIYYLLPQGHRSNWHRIRSDEIWHHYDGAPLKLVEITSEGRWCETTIGSGLSRGELPQYVVKAGNWFGACSLGSYSLVGCTVSPGFDFEDFELADSRCLAEEYPEFAEQILDLNT